MCCFVTHSAQTDCLQGKQITTSGINTNIFVALLQIRSILISPRLQCLATLLFNRHTRGLLPKISRPPMFFDNDENNHTILINRQLNITEEIDTHKNIPFLSIGPIIVVQCKVRGSLTHGSITGHGSDNNHGKSYKTRVTNME